MKLLKRLVLVACLILLNTSYVFSEEDKIWDPLEPVNRGVFWFNDQFDTYLAEPVASGYDKVTPDSWQIGVRNFFRNLRTPVQLVSNLAQLKFKDALKDTGRFLVNTTVGLGGVIDVAGNSLGLEYDSQDIGTALGYYGVPEGPYIVLPLLGPSNARDAVSLVAEVFLNPLYWLSTSNVFDSSTDTYVSGGASTLLFINTRAYYLDIFNDMKADSMDYYLAQQSYFSQFRRGEIKDALGVTEANKDDWYDDEEE